MSLHTWISVRSCRDVLLGSCFSWNKQARKKQNLGNNTQKYQKSNSDQPPQRTKQHEGLERTRSVYTTIKGWLITDRVHGMLNNTLMRERLSASGYWRHTCVWVKTNNSTWTRTPDEPSERATHVRACWRYANQQIMFGSPANTAGRWCHIAKPRSF